MSTQKKLATYIDHTSLKSNATQKALLQLCEEAKQYHFAGVCVNSCNISFIVEQLKGTDIKPIATVGFPLGATATRAKAFEAKNAISKGALEIDMVINIGALKEKNYRLVYEDILAVVTASQPHAVKVIIETCALTNEEKIAACVLAKAAGAAFIKTSTGFGEAGATIEDIELIRRIVGGETKIKASGGIRTKEDAKKMIEAGADRIGTSNGVAIVND
jgi:deoxyribose-phosphate aldolase